MKLLSFFSDTASGNVTCRVGITIQQEESIITFIVPDVDLTANAASNGRAVWSEIDICQLGAILIGTEITF